MDLSKAVFVLRSILDSCFSVIVISQGEDCSPQTVESIVGPRHFIDGPHMLRKLASSCPGWSRVGSDPVRRERFNPADASGQSRSIRIQGWDST